ncbi:MAG: hypothetical protein M0R68_01890 [Bacteroidetes bacterium]|nr:hypothetical protein [Bacteroidota bacterium]
MESNETQMRQDAMGALKVFGKNPKSEKNIAAVVSSSTKRDFALLIAIV